MTDGWLLKIDETGEIVWTQTYGGDSDEGTVALDQTSDGGYIMAGYTFTFGVYGDLWLIKTDGNGDTSWTLTYGDESEEGGGYSVQETSDGGYIVAGMTSELGTGGAIDVRLLKTDSEGNILWTKTYGDYLDEWAYSVDETSDGDYIITGFADTIGVWFGDLLLVKTDKNGDTLWWRTYRGKVWSRGYCVRETNDDGYIVAGVYGDTIDDGPISELWLLKTNSDGDTTWTKRFAKDNLGIGFWVEQTSDGGYIVTGCAGIAGAGMSDVWLLKTDAFGDSLWTRTYGGEKREQGQCVQQTADRGYIITGTVIDYDEGTSDLLLIKTDSLGYVAVSEPPVTHHQNWQVQTIGSRIVLHYTNRPQGFHASIYNAAGHKADELHSTQQSGTILWGQGFSPGVYFIREVENSLGVTRKVVLVK